MNPVRTFLRNILTAYFHYIPLPDSFRSILNQKRPVVIIAKSRSVLLESLLLSFCRRSTIPELPYLQGEMKNHEPELSWTSLHDSRSLAAIATLSAKPLLVTFNIFCGKGPLRSTPSYRLKYSEVLGVILGKPAVIPIFGAPFDLPDDSHELSSKKIARRIKLNFYHTVKLVRGAPFQSRAVQANIIFSGHDFEEEARQSAERLGISKDQFKSQARREFFRIAASPSRLILGILDFIAQVIIKRLFSNVNVTNLDRFVTESKQYPTVLLPTHRSHLDYIILSSVLYRSNVIPPIIAAGENLNFWPAGYFLRRAGAYFIKRSSRGDRIHAIVLRRYVTFLVKQGHLQQFFIEGGRSRSGRMLPPRLGLLRIIVEAFQNAVRNEVVFVPVSITYENVVEDRVFGSENTGRKKQKENLLSLIGARKIFRVKYGEVLINFGEPIKASQYFRMSLSDAGEIKTSVSRFAAILTKKIELTSNISLTSLVCTALLSAPRYSLTRADLVKSITELASFISVIRQRKSIGDLTPSLRSFLEGKHEILSDSERAGFLQITSCLNKEVYFIPGNSRFTADFYRNSSIHLFIGLSMLSITDLMCDHISLDEALKIHRLIGKDFILSDSDDFRAELAEVILALKRSEILSEATPLRFRNRESGVFIPALLLSTVQSHLWVYYNLLASHNSTDGAEDEVQVPYAQFMKRMQDGFKMGTTFGLVTQTEAASKANLDTALDSIAALGSVVLNDKRDTLTITRLQVDDFELLRRINGAIISFQQELQAKLSKGALDWQ